MILSASTSVLVVISKWLLVYCWQNNFEPINNRNRYRTIFSATSRKLHKHCPIFSAPIRSSNTVAIDPKWIHRSEQPVGIDMGSQHLLTGRYPVGLFKILLSQMSSIHAIQPDDKLKRFRYGSDQSVGVENGRGTGPDQGGERRVVTRRDHLNSVIAAVELEVVRTCDKGREWSILPWPTYSGPVSVASDSGFEFNFLCWC